MPALERGNRVVLADNLAVLPQPAFTIWPPNMKPALTTDGKTRMPFAFCPSIFAFGCRT